MKKYYAADNDYGSATDVGFANTWEVLVFDSKRARDLFVENGNCSTRAILKKEVTRYTNDDPEPFTGQRYMILDVLGFADLEKPFGYLGHVRVDYHDYPHGYKVCSLYGD